MRKYVLIAFFLSFAVPVGAQWNPDTLVNTPVLSYQPNAVELKKAVPDGFGGFIAAWTRSDAGQKKIFAQRVDGGGVRIWDTLGVAVALTDVDSSQVDMTLNPSFGSAFLAWKDNRAGTPGIYAQKLNVSGGTVGWTTNGVLVAGGAAVSTPRVAEDMIGGGAWISWMHPDAVGYYHARLQYLFQDGTARWPGGLDVLPIDSIQVKAIRMIVDGGGGVYIGVRRTVAGGIKDTISVVRFNNSGTQAWIQPVAIDTVFQDNYPFEMAMDNQANIYITGLMKNFGTEYMYIQKLSNSTGNKLWANPVNTNISTFPAELRLVPDFKGGAYVIVSGGSGTIYAQRVDSTGINQFGSTSLITTGASVIDTLDAAPDGQGGFLLSWTDNRSGTYKHVYGQRVSSAKDTLWAPGKGKTITAKPGTNQSRINILPDGLGGMYAVWHNPNDISAARLYNTGTLVGIGTPANLPAMQYGEGVKIFWNKISTTIYPKFKNYRVLRGTSPGFNPAIGVNIGTPPDTFIVDFPTPLGTPFYYRVAAVDSLNIAGAYSSEIKVIPMSFSKSLFDTLTPLPRVLSRMGAASIMENLYVAGGHGPSPVADTSLFKYSPGVSFLNGPWQFAKRMNYARNNHGVVELGGKIYAFGGKDSTNVNYFNTVEEYDPLNNAWTLKTPINTACSNFGYAVLNGLIYVAGGKGINDTTLRGMAAFNPIANTWTPKANLPIALASHGIAAGSDGNLYAFGGLRADSTLNPKVYKYSPGLNQWDSLSTSMPTPRFAMGCVSFRGKIYLIGGRKDTSKAILPTKIVEIFDPVAQTWSYTDNLPLGVSDFAATVYDPGIIIAGGETDLLTPLLRSRVDFLIPNPVFAEIGTKMKGKLSEIIHIPIYINGDLSADSVFSIEVGVTFSHSRFDSSSVTIGPLGSQFGSSFESKFKEGLTRDTLYLAMAGNTRATGSGKQLLADMNIKVMIDSAGRVDSIYIVRSIFNEGRPLLFRLPGTVRIQPVYGDVTKDYYGTVNASDASLVLQSRVRMVTLDTIQLQRADVSGKQAVTAYDASLILQYTVGLITSFPAESGYAPAKFAPVGPQLFVRTNMERGITEREIADVMIGGKGIQQGQIVAVPVSIENINSLYSLEMEFAYPKDQYEFLAARLGEPLKGFYMEKNSTDGHVILAIANSKPATEGGKMVELYFRQLRNEGDDIDLISMLINEEDVTRYLPKVGKPDQFALSQNYPNPFNPTTQIRYQLPDAVQVQLIIYNILGQEIRRLVDVKQNAGFYSMIWDGRNNSGLSVASGVYLYRLKAGSFVDTKKMIFLK